MQLNSKKAGWRGREEAQIWAFLFNLEPSPACFSQWWIGGRDVFVASESANTKANRTDTKTWTKTHRTETKICTKNN